jgi:hypothetical protein
MMESLKKQALSPVFVARHEEYRRQVPQRF